jgi:hypothetical protein
LKKILNWINNHKILVTIITVLVFIVPLIVVHILFKSTAIYSWFVATWSAGDLLGYIAGFASLLGTVFLGLITVYFADQANEINGRLGKENNDMQKIMAQKMLPVLRLESARTYNSAIVKTKPTNFPKSTEFLRVIAHNENEPNIVHQKVYVNIDVDTGDDTPLYVKQVNFKLVNISDTIFRHISLDHIEISGFKGKTEPVLCKNQTTGDGISALITTNEGVDVAVIVYTKNGELVDLWDNILGGLAFTLYVTNTSINGIQFQEYIDIRVADNNYVKISYGEKTANNGT